MIELVCGGDVIDLEIRTHQGWNITYFLDHIEECELCRAHKATLIKKLNGLISRRIAYRQPVRRSVHGD